MKNINSFTKWKNGSVDVVFTRAITHQKHLSQSGRSRRSAEDIFNTLRVFTKEPNSEQEINLECMNDSSCQKTCKSTVKLMLIILNMLIRDINYNDK